MITFIFAALVLFQVDLQTSYADAHCTCDAQNVTPSGTTNIHGFGWVATYNTCFMQSTNCTFACWNKIQAVTTAEWCSWTNNVSGRKQSRQYCGGGSWGTFQGNGAPISVVCPTPTPAPTPVPTPIPTPVPLVVHYSKNPASYKVGIAITPNNPYVGGTNLLTTYSASGLPTGLSMNASTGFITGSPTTVQAATSYTVTATKGSQTKSETINITILSAVMTPDIAKPKVIR